MGVQRMIEEDSYCLDVLDRLAALSAAAGSLSLLLLGNTFRVVYQVRSAVKTVKNRLKS